MKAGEITVDLIKSRCEYHGPNGCWVWKGGSTASGPYLFLTRNKRIQVSRVLWKLMRGAEPEFSLFSKCGDPMCVNPRHREDRRAPSKSRKLTAEFLKSRCQIEGTCWLWNEAVSGGVPRVSHNNKSSLAHRVLWEIVKGKKPDGELYATCGEKRCINPDHREEVERKDMPARQSKDGRIAAGKRLSIARAVAARKRSRINMERARQIRMDQRELAEIAAECGLSIKAVSNIKTGRTWREGVLA